MSDFRDLRKFGKAAVDQVMERVGRGMSKVQERTPLSYDLLESDDAYLVVFDAPGATAGDVQVRFLDGEIQVRIDRFREYYEGYDMRFPGRGLALDGRATLPADAAVNASEATASLAENGTLEVHIPKAGTALEVREESESDAESSEGEESEAAEESEDETDESQADESRNADS